MGNQKTERKKRSKLRNKLTTNNKKISNPSNQISNKSDYSTTKSKISPTSATKEAPFVSREHVPPSSCPVSSNSKNITTTTCPVTHKSRAKNLNGKRRAEVPSYVRQFFTPQQQTLALKSISPRTPSVFNKDKARSVAAADPTDPELNEVFNLNNIQGDVLKRYLLMVGLQINTSNTGAVAAVKTWLQQTVAPVLTNCTDIMNFRDAFRAKRFQTLSKVAALQSMQQVCVNIAFSSNGLKLLVGQAATNTFTDKQFQNDLLGSYTIYGDPTPDNWKLGGPGKVLDILIQIAADSQDLINQMENNIITPFVVQGGPLVSVYSETGFRSPELPGHEHFGFLDGIGQPSFRGVYEDASDTKTYFSPRTISPTDPQFNNYSYPGINLVWPGEFIFGHSTPDPQSPSSRFTGEDGGHSSPFFGFFPDWAKDGSLLTFRRLQQDVPMFWNFVKDANKSIINSPTVSDIDVASRFIGRWPSGAPLERSTLQDTTAMGDQPLSNSNFLYASATGSTPLIANGGQPDSFPLASADPNFIFCPAAGHIRKVQPRDDADTSPQLHRIIRRGSPYGEFITDKYTPDNVDRGLLFVAYSASISQGFSFLQSKWANATAVPRAGGIDFIIGQTPGNRTMTMQLPLDPANPTNPNYQPFSVTTSKKWVIPTGGTFMFVPPLSFFASDSILFK